MEQTEIESQLLIIVRGYLQELQSERAVSAITLNADLDRTLGIDSLGKIELFRRIEKKFSISLPESALAEARTLQDLAKIIQHSSLNVVFAEDHKQSIPAIEENTLNVATSTTLAEVITIYANQSANRPHVYLHDEQGKEKIITYGQLYAGAQAIARGLFKRGIQQGETIAIMLPTDETFFYAFFGIILAGAVPVPIYPPFRLDQTEEYAKREARILQNAQARILITFAQAETLSKILHNFIPSLLEVTTVENLQIQSGNLPDVTIQASDPALIQYTSGSTGDPKGVLLTHQNILANIHAMGEGIPVLPTDVVVSWLPLYHDMGLMNWLGGLYFGVPVTILSPITFLTRPERWLWAIHYHRATISGTPNFAYELCVKKINDENIVGLDLSSWKFAFNGAEAILPKTLENFTKKFAKYGFKADTFAPVYGLAENTVGLTLPTHKRVPLIDRILRKPFETEKKATPAKTEQIDVLEFVSCGQAIPEHEIRIVDDADNLLAERIFGNIQFKGPSAMQGYYNNPAITQKIYHNGWWDTGDLGYLADGELFVTGRKKDLIIKAGRNIAPEEVEDVVGKINGIRKGCVIAFGVNDPAIGTEKLIIVAETVETQKSTQQKIRANIIENMSIKVGLPPDTIILVAPRTIPKTSSGKLQRSACKQAFIDGKIAHSRLPAKIQLAKLAGLSLWKRIYHGITTTGKVLYSLYIALLILVTVPFIYISLFIFSSKTTGKIIKYWARNLFRLAFCPITIEGKEFLNEHSPMIFVSNHCSYVDSLLLTGILPANTLFTPKKELLQLPMVSTFIKKMNYPVIERLDYTKSIESKKHIEEALHQKKSIMLFPEATFTYATGLRPFKVGAFITATETLTPICAMSIQGTRNILRGNALLPKPGKIKLIIEKPIYPQNKEWNEVIRLHSLSRAKIAQNCGEPTIDVTIPGIEIT
jgi:fatty-acyl-CoA synthase